MGDDPALANVNADMTAWRLLDQLAHCTCGCAQQDHTDDDRCTRCPCSQFGYAPLRQPANRAG